jgi:hypothetical protein
MAAVRPFWTGIPRARRAGPRLLGCIGCPGRRPREQPTRVLVGRRGHVRAVAGEGEQQVSERRQNGDGRVAKPEEHLVIDTADVVDGEADDAADRLGVQKQQEAGDPFAHRRSLVGEQTPDQGEAAIPRDGCGIARRPARQSQPRHSVDRHRPAHESLGWTTGREQLAVPSVDVGLQAIGGCAAGSASQARKEAAWLTCWRASLVGAEPRRPRSALVRSLRSRRQAANCCSSRA